MTMIKLPAMLPDGYFELKPFTYYGAEPRLLSIDPHKEYVLPNGTIIVSRTDANGIITHINRAFELSSGYTKSELIGMPHCIIRHPDMPRSVFANMWEILQSGEEWKGYVKNLRKDGGFYWVYATIQPLVNNGVPYSYTSVRRKVTPEIIAKYEKIYADIRRTESLNPKRRK